MSDIGAERDAWGAMAIERRDSAVFVGIGAAAACLVVLASCGDEHDPPVPGFAFLDRGRLVLVDPAEDWGVGEPFFDPDEPAVGRAVDVATLPPSLAARPGARVILMDRAGPVCESRAGALSLAAFGHDVDGHDGSWGPSGYWDDLSPARLVADLAVEGRCDGATWAVIDQAAPPVVASVPADAPLAAAALARLRATRDYASLYEGLRARAADRGDDEALPAEEESVVRVGGIVAASIRVPLGWHYEPTADLFALTTLEGTPLGEPAPWFVTSISVFDLEGDGRDEILAESGDDERVLLTAPGPTYGVTASFSAATVFHGMP